MWTLIACSIRPCLAVSSLGYSFESPASSMLSDVSLDIEAMGQREEDRLLASCGVTPSKRAGSLILLRLGPHE